MSSICRMSYWQHKIYRQNLSPSAPRYPPWSANSPWWIRKFECLLRKGPPLLLTTFLRLACTSQHISSHRSMEPGTSKISLKNIKNNNIVWKTKDRRVSTRKMCLTNSAVPWKTNQRWRSCACSKCFMRRRLMRNSSCRCSFKHSGRAPAKSKSQRKAKINKSNPFIYG